MKLLAILIAGCCLLSAIAAPRAQAMGDFGFSKEPLVGKKAADFTLATIRNQKFNLAQASAGKKTVIFFMKTWCPICRDSLRNIQMMREEIEGQGIVVILVSVAEDRKKIEYYLKKYEYDFDIALDQQSSVSNHYQISGVPTLFYLDETRKIVAVAHSFAGDYQKYFK